MSIRLGEAHRNRDFAPVLENYKVVQMVAIQIVFHMWGGGGAFVCNLHCDSWNIYVRRPILFHSHLTQTHTTCFLECFDLSYFKHKNLKVHLSSLACIAENASHTKDCV